MDETTVTQRPDIDIEEDIREFSRTYDPLKQARGHFEYHSENGHVTLRGHVRTLQARRVLVDNVPDFPGVVSVDANELYDDEMLRIELGKVLPQGVFVRVNYGTVVLCLMPNQADQADALVEKAKKVRGVRPGLVRSELI